MRLPTMCRVTDSPTGKVGHDERPVACPVSWEHSSAHRLRGGPDGGMAPGILPSLDYPAMRPKASATDRVEMLSMQSPASTVTRSPGGRK